MSSDQIVWRLAGRSIPADIGVSDGPRLRWEDLDFDPLRRHPQLAQYHSAIGRRTERSEATDLQVVLAAIAERFHGIGEKRPPGSEPTASPGGNALDVDVDDLPGILPSDRDDTPGDAPAFFASSSGTGSNMPWKIGLASAAAYAFILDPQLLCVVESWWACHRSSWTSLATG